MIGFTFGMVWQSVLFTAAYMTLRVYAGGYHAPTQLRCYILSFIMVVTALLLIDWIFVYKRSRTADREMNRNLFDIWTS